MKNTVFANKFQFFSPCPSFSLSLLVLPLAWLLLLGSQGLPSSKSAPSCFYIRLYIAMHFPHFLKSAFSSYKLRLICINSHTDIYVSILLFTNLGQGHKVSFLYSLQSFQIITKLFLEIVDLFFSILLNRS